MPDWESDSPESRTNLKNLLHEIVRSSREREMPTLETARQWHRAMMKGLSTPKSSWVGAFRGEAGLEGLEVQIGPDLGASASSVADELSCFQVKLHELIEALDLLLPPGAQLDLDQLSAILDLCAWAHTEWVCIHPFVNGSGRTARLWANCLAVRYGLPPFIRLRPRPGSGYGEAGASAMQRDWTPTATLFRQLLDQFLNEV